MPQLRPRSRAQRRLLQVPQLRRKPWLLISLNQGGDSLPPQKLLADHTVKNYLCKFGLLCAKGTTGE